MTQEELNKEFIAQFEQSRKNIEKKFAPWDRLPEDLNNIGKILNEYSVRSDQHTKEQFQVYFSGIKEKMIELNDDVETLKYLLAEKEKYEQKIIECNIIRDKENSKFFKKAIDEIISPIINSVKAKLELKRDIPSLKKNTVVANISTPQIVNNKPTDIPVKIIQEKHIPPVERIIPKVIETVPKELLKPLPVGFKQIECPASKEEIEYYFMILSKEKNYLNNEIFMEEQDVLQFLKKNFAVFNSIPSGEYFPINILPNQKKILIYFLFGFYIKYDYKKQNSKGKYIQLLIDNFELFKDDKLLSSLSNMSESKRPKKEAIIDTKKYFKK